MTNWYATRADLAARLGIPTGETSKDTLMDDVLENVSREIERYCGQRWFYPRTETRYFTPSSHGPNPFGSHILVDDLLTVSEIATDTTGALVYDTVWTANVDYALQPKNAPLGAIPAPYWRVEALPFSSYWFPAWPDSVRITGTWGYHNVRRTATATLGAAIVSTTATTLTLSAAPDVAIGHTITVDSETMFVSGLSGVTATVTRGVNGTTAATHLTAAPIQIQTYPAVRGAALMQAAMDFVAGEGAGLARGGGGMGQALPAGGLHPWTQRMLSSYVLMTVG